jgi:hypothetical protein
MHEKETGYRNSNFFIRTGLEFKVKEGSIFTLRAHLGKHGNLINMLETEIMHKVSKKLVFKYSMHYHNNPEASWGRLPAIGL